MKTNSLILTRIFCFALYGQIYFYKRLKFESFYKTRKYVDFDWNCTKTRTFLRYKNIKTLTKRLVALLILRILKLSSAIKHLNRCNRVYPNIFLSMELDRNGIVLYIFLLFDRILLLKLDSLANRDIYREISKPGIAALLSSFWQKILILLCVQDATLSINVQCC